MYDGELISGLMAMVDRAFERSAAVKCSLIDEAGYECNSAAVILLLPGGDESRCIRHLEKGPQL